MVTIINISPIVSLIMVLDPKDLDDWKSLPSRKIDEASEPTISRILEAIKKREKIRITYLKGSDPGASREITPQEIFERQNYYYLEAYCHAREDRRCFRIDRIRIAGLVTRKPAKIYEVDSKPRQYKSENTVKEVKSTPRPQYTSSTNSAYSSSGSGGSGCLVLFVLFPLMLTTISIGLYLMGVA